MVYAIGLESHVPFGGRRAPGPGMGGYGGRGGLGGRSSNTMVSQKPDEGLAKIALETGGGYFELMNTQDMQSTFARVADELHQQYALGFVPLKLDGKTHKLEVRVKRPGMTARARKSVRRRRRAARLELARRPCRRRHSSISISFRSTTGAPAADGAG